MDIPPWFCGWDVKRIREWQLWPGQVDWIVTHRHAPQPLSVNVLIDDMAGGSDHLAVRAQMLFPMPPAKDQPPPGVTEFTKSPAMGTSKEPATVKGTTPIPPLLTKGSSSNEPSLQVTIVTTPVVATVPTTTASSGRVTPPSAILVGPEMMKRESSNSDNATHAAGPTTARPQ